MATIKVLSSSDDVWDEFAIVRIKNGQTTAQVWLTNESYVFSADKDGKIPLTTVETDLVCYNNGTHVTIPQGNVTIGTPPTGMTVSTLPKANGDLTITFTATEGATFGDVTSGSIPVTLVDPVPGVSMERTVYFKFAKVTAGAQGSTGGDGAGVESIQSYYMLSDSATQAPDFSTGRSSLLGEFVLGKSQLGIEDPEANYIMTDDLPYLWSYDVITYTDGRVVAMDPHVIGVRGEQGASGVNFMLNTP